MCFIPLTNDNWCPFVSPATCVLFYCHKKLVLHNPRTRLMKVARTIDLMMFLSASSSNSCTSRVLVRHSVMDNLSKRLNHWFLQEHENFYFYVSWVSWVFGGLNFEIKCSATVSGLLLWASWGFYFSSMKLRHAGGSTALFSHLEQKTDRGHFMFQ